MSNALRKIFKQQPKHNVVAGICCYCKYYYETPGHTPPTLWYNVRCLHPDYQKEEERVHNDDYYVFHRISEDAVENQSPLCRDVNGRGQCKLWRCHPKYLEDYKANGLTSGLNFGVD